MSLASSPGRSRFSLVPIVLLLLAVSLCAQPWIVLGPNGGDVRTLSYNPHNPDQILLGTSTGEIYISKDAGRSWSRSTHLGAGQDYVLDHIVFDPHQPDVIYIGAWSVNDQTSGDFYRSKDGGKTWDALPGIKGKSIRALAIAPSDSRQVVAGAIDGVYRSKDGGDTWAHISPANYAELRNVESIAVDPKNPDIIYAGTWHLAWKTSDGGSTWNNVHQGMIDDSDVFSIIVDYTNPLNVYASACSGIYKSTSGGDTFQKVQGIPFTARRTRVLHQDPSNPLVVYAGTTEGLWKTADGGKAWKRMTGPEVVVNDVMVDPRNSNRVLIGTDRAGVLASDNAAASFTSSNEGYSHRYVGSVLADAQNPDILYAGIVNDRELGGIYTSHDGGKHWVQRTEGLGIRDVFTLRQAATGTIIAGTNRGIYALEPDARQWRPINSVIEEKTVQKTVYRKGRKPSKVPLKLAKKSTLEARVNEIEIAHDHWLAATSSGLYNSKDQGKSWTAIPVTGAADFIAATDHEGLIVAATRDSVFVSKDDGATWINPVVTNSYKLNIRGVTFAQDNIYLATRESAFRSSDKGDTWKRMLGGLPDREITSIVYDAPGNRLLATSYASNFIWQSTDQGKSWKKGPDTGYPLRRISVVRGRYMAATPFDGVILQPEEEAPKAAASNAGEN